MSCMLLRIANSRASLLICQQRTLLQQVLRTINGHQPMKLVVKCFGIRVTQKSTCTDKLIGGLFIAKFVVSVFSGRVFY